MAWGLDKPDFGIGIVLDRIIPKIRNAALRKCYQDSRQLLVAEEGRFCVQANAIDLGGFFENHEILAALGAQEIVSTYDSRMAKDGSAGRDLYDKLLGLAPHGRCPFCGHRDVQSLDHTLPKQTFPTVAIVPENLVPCCSRCNQFMGQMWGADLALQFFNPYVEHCDTHDWLTCEIEPSIPAGIEFRVAAPPEWSDMQATRLARQFEILRLGRLYSSEAAGYLASLRLLFARLLESVGPDGVREELAWNASSFAQPRRNSWQRAFFAAASRCDWFCAGGFIE